MTAGHGPKPSLTSCPRARQCTGVHPPPERPVPPIPPPRLARRPRDRHGRVVPWFVAVIDGVPDFRVIRHDGVRDATRFKVCWLCGVPLGANHAFVVGPMCTVTRVSPEPPSHRDCAEYAALACPFLITPHMRRRESGLPENAKEPDGEMCRRNPGVAAVWVTKRWTKQRGLWLFDLGEPTEVTWYAEGRLATRAEVCLSLDSGMEVLRAKADQDDRPEAARALLQQQHEQALELLPAPAGLTHAAVADLVWDALGRAVEGDTEGAAADLFTIGIEVDGNMMYGVCCAIAEAGHHILKRLYGDRAPRPGTDDMWRLMELEPGALLQDPVHAFSVRFLAAHANGDGPTAMALFNAALRAPDDLYVRSVCRLLADVAGLARLAIDKQAGES